MSLILNEPMVNYQVHTTTDYFLFKKLNGNRKPNTLHLNRLKDAMSKNYLFTVITVNENYEIIDGQHRFYCIEELNLPLHYIICKGYGLKEVQILNATSKTWNADDYLTGYIDLGYKDYFIYKTFKNKYEFGHNECMAILSGRSCISGYLNEQFKNGLFKIKDLQESESIADKIYLFKNLYEGFKRRSFIRAILSLLKNPNFEFIEFLQKVKLSPSALTDCSTSDAYISLIEEIYNYRRREKVNLRY